MPPGFIEPSREAVPKCLMSDDNNARYIRMVENYADIIAGQFFGHLHADTFRIFYNSTSGTSILFLSYARKLHIDDLSSNGIAGKPISHAFVTPSITPKDYNNPGFRLYKFDENTGKVCSNL